MLRNTVEVDISTVDPDPRFRELTRLIALCPGDCSCCHSGCDRLVNGGSLNRSQFKERVDRFLDLSIKYSRSTSFSLLCMIIGPINIVPTIYPEISLHSVWLPVLSGIVVLLPVGLLITKRIRHDS